MQESLFNKTSLEDFNKGSSQGLFAGLPVAGFLDQIPFYTDSQELKFSYTNGLLRFVEIPWNVGLLRFMSSTTNLNGPTVNRWLKISGCFTTATWLSKAKKRKAGNQWR